MKRPILSRILIAVALLLAALLLGLLITQDRSDPVSIGNQQVQRLVYLFGYLLLLSGSVIGAVRTEGANLFKYAAIWVAIGGVIALVYQVTH